MENVKCCHCREVIIPSLKNRQVWIHKDSRLAKCTTLTATPEPVLPKGWRLVPRWRK